ncbi:uncharacterized protein [Ptychodera flava]|uniref:uncharacterized protein n=1 Tax=Ptychodera flava TaxID=63121 RepID=UPI00396A07B0
MASLGKYVRASRCIRMLRHGPSTVEGPWLRQVTTSCQKIQPISFAGSHRSLSIDTRIEKDGAHIDVTFKSGLPYDIPHEYDATWKPYLWCLQKVFHSVRAALMRDRLFADHIIDNKNGLYVLGCQNEISNAFYDVLDKNPTAPAVISIFLTDIGTTSEGVKHELRSLNNNELLSSAYLKVVTVDLETRKPKPHSEQFIKKFTPYITGTGTALMKALKYPGKSYKYTATVLPSDIDFYSHVSYLSFLKYCSNCASTAFKAVDMKNFTGDFEPYKVKKVSSLYLGEAKLHDKLDVDMWEDEERRDTLNFIISKAGANIFHCIVQLYV